MIEPVRVPAAEFGGDEFWRRLNAIADGRGHQGHPRQLVGDPEATDRYTLRCVRCDTSVLRMRVDRTGV